MEAPPLMADESVDRLVTPTVRWFQTAARPLPWRAEDRTAWGVLVSEVMLQQTQVDRVIGYWLAWMQRWPTPVSLAEDDLAEVLRMWGRLGYPRRAKRLHSAARLIVELHGGEVPSGTAELRALPGIGEYTAAAVQAFAFGLPSTVLDTNVRRVLARTLAGKAAAAPSISAAERALATELAGTGPDWSAAVMELGALVCTARNPACPKCPVRSACSWLAAGSPPAEEPVRRQPRFEGSDRQVRGLVLDALRGAGSLDGLWPDSEQLQRALDGLVRDGLIEHLPNGDYRLASSR